MMNQRDRVALLAAAFLVQTKSATTSTEIIEQALSLDNQIAQALDEQEANNRKQRA
jgi:hypothetical protein